MASVDLCSVDDVRAFLQKPSADTTQDALIGDLITRASRLIIRHTEREFAPTSTAVTRKFEWNGGGFLSLAPYDASSITSVQRLLYDDSPVTLGAIQWRAWPVQPVDGVYSSVRIWGTVPQSVGIRPTVITITGNWGFPTIPDEVRSACIETVTTWMRRDVAAFSTTYNLDEARVERPEVLPSSAARKLDYFRRVMQG
tara:strand:- start:48 stop:641 length:594 start_codon:yes stop_codon:yes gene_type:complete